MKRILVGYDGSAYADMAVELAGSLGRGPEASVVLVNVYPDIRSVRSAWGALVIGPSAQIDRELTEQAEATLEVPNVRLGSLGVRCETIVGRGRAPQVLVAEAKRTAADLVVVGSRGLGPIRSTLLGSVSQEVVDLSPCPVLVARTPAVSQIVLGTDGSPSAEAAERFLGRLAVARQVPVIVVSVAEILRPLVIGMAPTVYGQAMGAQTEYEAETARAHLALAEAAAERLRADGVDATAVARTGDPAEGLLAAATDVAADLIVVGSRGRTGLKRLALGSVARRVVQHAKASVLVARTRLTRRGSPRTESVQGGDSEPEPVLSQGWRSRRLPVLFTSPMPPVHRRRPVEPARRPGRVRLGHLQDGVVAGGVLRRRDLGCHLLGTKLGWRYDRLARGRDHLRRPAGQRGGAPGRVRGLRGEPRDDPRGDRLDRVAGPPGQAAPRRRSTPVIACPGAGLA